MSLEIEDSQPKSKNQGQKKKKSMNNENKNKWSELLVQVKVFKILNKLINNMEWSKYVTKLKEPKQTWQSNPKRLGEERTRSSGFKKPVCIPLL